MPKIKSTVLAPLVVVGVIGLYFGVMAAIRSHVDGEIAKNVGEQVIDFELPGRDGRTWTAQELRGKTVILHFFRSRCVSCKGMRNEVVNFEKALDPAKAQMLYVLVDRVQGYSEEESQATLEYMNLDGPVVDANEAFVDAFHGAGWANVTPVTYVIDPDGKVQQALRGYADESMLRAAVPKDVLRGS